MISEGQQYDKYQASQNHALSLYNWLIDWLIKHGLTSPPTLHQHSIRYTDDCFYMSEDPTNSIEVLKEDIEYTINRKNTISKHINIKHSKSRSLQ